MRANDREPDTPDTLKKKLKILSHSKTDTSATVSEMKKKIEPGKDNEHPPYLPHSKPGLTPSLAS